MSFYPFRQVQELWNNVKALLSARSGLVQGKLPAFALVTMFSFLVSCSSSMDSRQAGLYLEYEERLQSLDSYDEIKELNNKLNNEIEQLIRENSDEVVERSNKADKGDMQDLNKAEKKYVDAYLAKIAPLIISKQNEAYDNSLAELLSSESSAELVAAKNRADAEIAKLQKENKWELSQINTDSRYQKELAGILSKKTHFDTIYIKAVAPCMVNDINGYAAAAANADGYEQLFEVKNRLQRALSVYCTEKDVVLNNLITGRECNAEIVSIREAKYKFDAIYYERFIPCYLEVKREMFEGIITLLEDIDNSEDINDLTKYFGEIQNSFLSAHAQEERWIENMIKSGNVKYGKEINEIDSVVAKMNEIYNEKYKFYNKIN